MEQLIKSRSRRKRKTYKPKKFEDNILSKQWLSGVLQDLKIVGVTWIYDEVTMLNVCKYLDSRIKYSVEKRDDYWIFYKER
jgi:hypothetical protein